MNALLRAVTAAALLCGAGCIFEPYRETARFDLPVTTVDAGGAARVFAVEFRNLSGGETAMLLRDPDGRVFADPYARWLVPPGELVPRALNAAFPAAPDAGKIGEIGGEVRVFEVNRADRTFVFAGSWHRRDGAGAPVRFRYTAPLAEETPAGIAAAAAATVNQLATVVAATLAQEP